MPMIFKRRDVPSWVAVILPTAIVILILAASVLAKSWSWLSGTHHLPDFLDLQQVTYTSGCVQTDPTWDMDSPTCDPGGREYNYPSAWVRILSHLGVDGSDTGMLGILLILIYLCAVLTLSYSSRFTLREPLRLSVFSISVIAPPIWLALDRGSTDILILMLLLLSSLALARGLSLLGIAGISLATLLKLFSFGALPSVLVNAQHRLRHALISLALLISIAIILRPELARISARTPRSSETSFGMAVIPIRLQHALPQPMSSGRTIGLIGIAALVLGVVAFLVLLRVLHFGQSFRVLAHGLTQDPYTLQLLLVSLGAFLVAYGAGTNYDYRLIFLLPIILAFLRLRGPSARMGLVAAGLLTLLMMMSSQIDLLGNAVDWLFLVVTPIGLTLYVFVAYLALRRDSQSSVVPHG